MTDDSVIEEAAKAMWEVKYGDTPPAVISDGTEIMQMARAAFAAIKKAHAPTVGEREEWRDESIRRYPHAEHGKYMRQGLQNAFIEGAEFAGFLLSKAPETRDD